MSQNYIYPPKGYEFVDGAVLDVSTVEPYDWKLYRKTYEAKVWKQTLDKLPFGAAINDIQVVLRGNVLYGTYKSKNKSKGIKINP